MNEQVDRVELVDYLRGCGLGTVALVWTAGWLVASGIVEDDRAATACRWIGGTSLVLLFIAVSTIRVRQGWSTLRRSRRDSA